jgi:Do/DeqQ family serine protease
MNRQRIRKVGVFTGAILAFMVVAWSVQALTSGRNDPPRPSQAHLRIISKPGVPVDLSTAFIKVAKQTIPAVVYIEVTESREVQNPFGPFQNDPFFRRFFDIPKMPPKMKQEIKGLGSGMIVDPQGYILTNFHVAGSATKMEVTLADGSKHSAKLVGGDPKTDLAVIHISTGRPLPYVTFGDSDALEVGEWVVAIGAPRALEKSVTQGIISAKHRAGITDPDAYQDFLQTDAPINPGNSGGPLLNLYGQVVGVNAAIASQSGGFEGIGFTIPSKMAVSIANALISRGKVERGWLGVSIRDLTPDIAKEAHVAGTTTGALVADVVKGSPADKAGLKKNDVVTHYEGKDTPDASTFRNEVAQTAGGKQARLTVLRNGKKEELAVRIGSPEEAATIMAALANERFGVEVRLPTSKERERYGLDANQGVVIKTLHKDSPLGAAGFEAGDMILLINNRPVDGVEAFSGIVSSLPSKQKVTIGALDHRTGNTGSIIVTLK